MSSDGALLGWTGTVLRVNLTRGAIQREALRADWARDYVGGRGIGARYLHEELNPRVDPLAPENLLIFATGPLTGTNASCGSRYMVVTKGPLTGCITTSNSGGLWGPELKFAGYDMIVLEGRAERPVYLWILDDRVELRPTRRTSGARASSRPRTGSAARPACPTAPSPLSGRPARTCVLFAAIVNDKFRAAGRSGVGAVMGSKNLKAIAVRGTGAVRRGAPRGHDGSPVGAEARRSRRRPSPPRACPPTGRSRS